MPSYVQRLIARAAGRPIAATVAPTRLPWRGPAEPPVTDLVGELAPAVSPREASAPPRSVSPPTASPHREERGTLPRRPELIRPPLEHLSDASSASGVRSVSGTSRAAVPDRPARPSERTAPADLIPSPVRLPRHPAQPVTEAARHARGVPERAPQPPIARAASARSPQSSPRGEPRIAARPHETPAVPPPPPRLVIGRLSVEVLPPTPPAAPPRGVTTVAPPAPRAASMVPLMLQFGLGQM